MESLFDASGNQRIIDRINSLTPLTPAKWGKMNVAQMLTHCQVPLDVAFGNAKIKRGLLGILLGRMIKNSLLKNEEPFKKGWGTDKSFIVADMREFDKEKSKLIALVQKFVQLGNKGISKEPHPLFGTLTAHEWDVLQWKHLDHHLRQFGA